MELGDVPQRNQNLHQILRQSGYFKFEKYLILKDFIEVSNLACLLSIQCHQLLLWSALLKLLRKLLLQKQGTWKLHVEKFVDMLSVHSYSRPKLSSPRITLHSQLDVDFSTRSMRMLQFCSIIVSPVFQNQTQRKQLERTNDAHFETSVKSFKIV